MSERSFGPKAREHGYDVTKVGLFNWKWEINSSTFEASGRARTRRAALADIKDVYEIEALKAQAEAERTATLYRGAVR